MMRQIDNVQRLFAVSSYARAKEGDFTGRRRTSTSTIKVASSVIQVDAVLRGILASLRAMREICASCLESDISDEDLALRNAELDDLKENISRLSAQIAGTEFKMFSIHGSAGGNDLQSIDEAITEMSGKISEFEETSSESGEERASAWMRELFGE